MVRKDLFIRLKALAAVVCLSVTLTACRSAAVFAAPDIDADALIVGLEDVQRVTDRDDLTAGPVIGAPQAYPENSRVPDPCRPVFGLEEAFGNNWSQFRGVTYATSGGAIRTISTVAQNIGVYPDAGMARDEFDRLVTSFEACAKLREKLFDFSVNKQDPSTVALAFSGNATSVILRVTSSVLIDVVIQGIPRSDQVAEAVTQMISERVN
ncbi:sensor domain-containing protein [Mycolicibacter minnesotensis]